MAAAAAQEPVWKTGPALAKQLEAPLAVTWKDAPLRRTVTQFGARSEVGVAVMVDRRIDPDQLVTLQAHDRPLDEIFARLADQLEIGVCRVGPVVYFAPKQTAVDLATVAALRRDDLRRRPADARAALVRLRPLAWKELAEPRALVKQWADELGLTIMNLDLIPHDLWPAANLPPLDAADRLTLLLAGFGLTFDFPPEGTAVTLVPMPKEAKLAKSYPLRGEAAEAVAKIREIAPDAEIEANQRTVSVVARWEEHEHIDRLLRGEPVRQRTVATNKRYSLRVEQHPIGGVLNQLAGQLSLELKIAPTLEERLEQRVSFDLREATLDELMKAVLEPAKLKYRIENGALRIFAGGE